MTRRRVRRVCPHCHQRVAVTFRTRRFLRHDQAVLRRCPESGRPAPVIPAACVVALEPKDALMSTKRIPVGYEWPGPGLSDRTGPLYWLAPHDDGKATQLFMVIAADGVGQHIAAEQCYLHWGVKIVDALRAAS